MRTHLIPDRISNREMRLCIVTRQKDSISETFIHAHAQRLPGVRAVVYLEGGMPTIAGEPPLVQSLGRRVLSRIRRAARGSNGHAGPTQAYLAAFRRHAINVVLAEYGNNGVRAMEAARMARVPLVVHFHGYDATRHDVLSSYGPKYKALFDEAFAVVVVSKPMKAQVLRLGANPDRIVLNPYGVDVHMFCQVSPEKAPPNFVAVGRLVEKKAPHLTLMALAKARQSCPEIRLTMVGDGNLRGVCHDLIQQLEISDSVKMLGAQPHARVAEIMHGARAFVQHSVEAHDGDSEGMPNSVLEAAASGLPIVATRHAGIPDAVIDGRTGFLVAERDVDRMAEYMVRLARNPSLAGDLGRAGRQHIIDTFSMDYRIGKLRELLERAAMGSRASAC